MKPRMPFRTFGFHVDIHVTEGEENPLKEELLSSDTDLICPYVTSGGYFGKPASQCGERAVKRYSLGRHTRIACSGGKVLGWGGDDEAHSELAKKEVVQAFWEEMLELHGRNPK